MEIIRKISRGPPDAAKTQRASPEKRRFPAFSLSRSASKNETTTTTKTHNRRFNVRLRLLPSSFCNFQRNNGKHRPHVCRRRHHQRGISSKGFASPSALDVLLACILTSSAWKALEKLCGAVFVINLNRQVYAGCVLILRLLRI